LQIVRILESSGIDSKIKWVNDVLVNGRKISGVLCESIAGVRGEDIAVIVSIGLNVNASLLDLSGLEGIATSMKMESNKQYDLQQLIMQLSSSLLASINNLFASGFGQFRPEISQRLERFDARVVTLRSLSVSSMRGVIKDIGDSGELIVETERGVIACFEGSILI
jgi:BirA family biotin operon repressor/biotin-[acetyl-CoA-carboxylase] ligase